MNLLGKMFIYIFLIIYIHTFLNLNFIIYIYYFNDEISLVCVFDYHDNILISDKINKYKFLFLNKKI